MHYILNLEIESISRSQNQMKKICVKDFVVENLL